MDANKIREHALVMANARAIIKAHKSTTNWQLYARLFGTGRTTAYARCRDLLGLDADGNKTCYNDMMDYITKYTGVDDGR